MEGFAKACEQIGHFLNQRFFGPGGEVSPVVFGMLPEDFDQVEFRAVGREMHKQEAMLDEPAIDDCRVDVEMDRGIVQDQDRPFLWIGSLCQAVDETDDIFPADGVVADLEMQLRPGIVQGAKHIGPLSSQTGIGRMRLPQGRPAALDIGQAGKAGFVKMQQVDQPVPGALLDVGQGVANALEARIIPLFFSDSRVRLKDSPRALRPTESRSRLKAGAEGKRPRTRAAIFPRVNGSWRAISAATSSISAVSFTGAPPLWPSRMPTSPFSRQPLAQLYTGWSLTWRKSVISTTLRPACRASNPKARRLKSPYRWCLDSSSRVTTSSGVRGRPNKCRFWILRMASSSSKPCPSSSNPYSLAVRRHYLS